MAKVEDRDEVQVRKALVNNIANDTLDLKRDIVSEKLNHYVGKYFIISLKGTLELIGGKIVEIKHDDIFEQKILYVERITDQSIRGIPVTSISNFENHFNNNEEVISKLEILSEEQLARKGSYHLTELGIFFVSSIILDNLEYKVVPVQRPPSKFLDTPLYELTKSSINNDVVEYSKYSNFFSYVLINEIFRLMINFTVDEYLEMRSRKYISYVLTDIINDISSVRDKKLL